MGVPRGGGGRGRAAARPGAWWRGDQGQGLVEYALILMFIGLVLAGALLMFGRSISNLLQPIIAAV